VSGGALMRRLWSDRSLLVNRDFLDDATLSRPAFCRFAAVTRGLGSAPRVYDRSAVRNELPEVQTSPTFSTYLCHDLLWLSTSTMWSQ